MSDPEASSVYPDSKGSVLLLILLFILLLLVHAKLCMMKYVLGLLKYVIGLLCSHPFVVCNEQALAPFAICCSSNVEWLPMNFAHSHQTSSLTSKSNTTVVHQVFRSASYPEH